MATISRRDMLRATAATLLAAAPAHRVAARQPSTFRISLAQWSLHRTLRSGGLDHLDFARVAKRDYGVCRDVPAVAFRRFHADLRAHRERVDRQQREQQTVHDEKRRIQRRKDPLPDPRPAAGR